MIGTGIKASRLIKKLEKLINRHGDQMVWVSSGDYPSGCAGVEINHDKADGYTPQNAFVVYGGG